jgi:hypothetical protein
MKAMRNAYAYNIPVRKSEGNISLGRPGCGYGLI